MAGKKILSTVLGLAAACGLTLAAKSASAAPQLQYVYGGSAGTVVFIHGKAECSTSMSDCNGGTSTGGPASYWTNRATGANMLNEATTKYTTNGTQYYEAFAIGYDLANQGYWSSANDVAYCLRDLVNGTNGSGCNPSLYRRTNFHVVTHSAGGAVIDRILSSGWWQDVNNAIVGNVVTLSPALAGSRSSSALYGVDGYGGWCSTLVSWLAGWSLKNNGAQSLTRGAVVGEANKGYQGRSPRWLLKVVSTGGGGSANNAGVDPVFGTCGWGSGICVDERDNDFKMGALSGCLGYSSSDDTDGLLYFSDEDPTSNTAANGCYNDSAYGNTTCKYYSQYSGAYWHWFTSWGNHSHTRDDAYVTKGDWNSTSGCYYRSPGTCVGQYGL
jgi:hypothetical protein